MPLPISLQQTYQVSGLAIHISVSLETTKRRGWDEPSLIWSMTKFTDYHLFRNSLYHYLSTLDYLSLDYLTQIQQLGSNYHICTEWKLYRTPYYYAKTVC